mmetsp:Transcript_17787/g.21314  ORF Transcript_17787/g.21314 Transcript_17787/m.21314 type:complete len:276 (-) Transcript_17787:87-914(-)
MSAVASLNIVARFTAKGTKAGTKKGRKFVPAPAGYFPGGLYPEGLPNLPGSSPYDSDFSETLWPNWAEGKDSEQIAKLAETELIHGRWAMMGVAGSWGAEVGTGIPWFKAGALCTPEDCTAMSSIFPGQVIDLAPEGSGFPSFYNVLAFEVITIGLSEAYRTGLIDPAFPELEVGDLHPGGEHFDPLGLADTFDLDEMKVAEIKHARLSMLAWLGFLSQAVATNCDNPFGFGSETWPSYIDGAVGPFANWQAHLANPVSENVWKYIGLESTAGYV